MNPLFKKMAALCAKREYAPRDIRAKLERETSDELLIDETLHRLTAENFLSPTRFAEAFVRDKFHLNGWGPRKIRYELLLRQIPESIADEALRLLSPEEIEAARQALILKKHPDYPLLPAPTLLKLRRYLFARGF